MSLKKMNKKKLVPYGVPIESGTADSILASFLRKIYKEINMDVTKFDILVSRYVDKFSKETSSRVLSSERGNIKKELTAETISWNVFLSKGLGIINAKKIKVIIEITHSNNIITTHEKEAELANFVTTEEPDESEDG